MSMFKKLRIKIIIVMTSIFTILFSGILISIYTASYQKSISDAKFILRIINKKNGFNKIGPANKKTKNNEYYYDATRFYLVSIRNKDKTVLRIANDNNSGFTDKQLGDLALKLSQKDVSSGIYKNLTYLIQKRSNNTYVAFSNNSIQSDYFKSLLYTILTFGCIGILLLFVISILLSRWLVMPVEDAFQKQKNFISDASHELKTPVAIISSNADALKREIGESKWLEYINIEILRMNQLIIELLDLAKVDSNDEKRLYQRVNLSDIVMSIVLPFESIAFEKQINLNEQINDNINVVGDSFLLGQLTSILIDNAFHHTEKGGYINVGLKQQHNKKILTVSNTGKPIKIDEQELIFERFYRADEARSKGRGNYGLGLAIAKSITNSHNGKISVSCEDNWTTFKVIL